MSENSNYISENANIINCKLGNFIKIWNNVRISNSILKDHVSIGDDCNITDSQFEDWVNIQRQNWIFNSKFNRYSYTGRNLNCWYSDIGSFSSISWNVTIGAADHNYKKLTTSAFLFSDIFDIRGNNKEMSNDKSRCQIGSDVWIGCDAVIRRNIHIGDGAVIGSNSVVSKDVAPFSIVAGSPAKHIKFRFDCELIKDLLEIKWWDFPIEIIKENFNLFNTPPNFQIINKLYKIRNQIS